MSETSSSMHGKSGEQKPQQAPRQMKAAIRCRSEDDAYPHQALQAYSNLWWRLTWRLLVEPCGMVA